jgi:hypothetical protein
VKADYSLKTGILGHPMGGSATATPPLPTGSLAQHFGVAVASHRHTGMCVL